MWKILAVGLCAAQLACASPQKAVLQLRQNDPPTQNRAEAGNSSASSSASTNGAINCSEPTTGIDQSCWKQLNLSDYVREWVDNHECYKDEGFSACYSRMQGYLSADCSAIGVGGNCPPVTALSSFTPEQFYILYTIYSINNFFATWYSSLSGITPAFSSTASKVLQAFELRKGKVSADNVTAQANAVVRTTQANLRQTLSSVVSNVTEFLAFAEQGNFTQPPAKDYSFQSQNYLTFAFNTYITSYALKSNNIYGTIGLGTNPSQLAANGTKLAYPITCSNSTDNSICDAWWYSENLESAFGLVNTDVPTKNYGPALAKVFDDTTTGELLFEAAYQCSRSDNSTGVSSQNAPNITIAANGVNTACISTLDVQVWDMSCHTDPKSDDGPNCEYLERARDDKFWKQSNGKYQVPYAYLGPALSTPGYSLSRT